MSWLNDAELAERRGVLQVDVHELGQADVGRVLRPHAHILPAAPVDGGQTEFVGQKAVFLAQPVEVVVGQGFAAALFAHGVGVQQAGLPAKPGVFPASCRGKPVAHSSNVSALVPKPKLRARLIKHTRSQSPVVWCSHWLMRCVFCSSRSVVRADSQLGGGARRAAAAAVPVRLRSVRGRQSARPRAG